MGSLGRQAGNQFAYFMYKYQFFWWHHPHVGLDGACGGEQACPCSLTTTRYSAQRRGLPRSCPTQASFPAILRDSCTKPVGHQVTRPVSNRENRAQKASVSPKATHQRGTIARCECRLQRDPLKPKCRSKGAMCNLKTRERNSFSFSVGDSMKKW